MSRNATLFDLTGRVALVTGGSSGIGLAMAQALAGAGAAVVLVARRDAALREAAQRITAAGGKAAHVAWDVSERSRLGDCVAQAAAHFGAPDILVNAAGINLREPAERITEASWDAQLLLNLTVPFFLARQVVPQMIAKGWGRIINVASMQSLRAFPDSAPYGASKGGVVQLTRAMAEAWSAHGVTCNAIGPGFFPTALTAPVYADAKRVAQLAARTMIGRNGELEDLHGLTVFLAAPASDYITGQTIYIDGGFSAK
ncbi:MAG: SDR family oxidoreductase [Betaproteobacteria bacterium]|nr:SDR family oxidoreductase [Betaproteobacteria bacterium]